MIVYLLIIIFFVLLFYKQNEYLDFFVDYRDVYSEKGKQIYKGMYKCNEYEDIKLKN